MRFPQPSSLTFVLMIYQLVRRVPGVRGFGLGGGSSPPRIPKSASDRDTQAIRAVQQAIQKPRSTAVPVIECEFPALANQNKLGDGSRQSANQVDEANLQFVNKLLQDLSPALPFMGPRPWLLTSTAATKGFIDKARLVAKRSNSGIHCLKDGLPTFAAGETAVCVVVTPSASRDYQAIQELAASGNTKVVLINGYAKDNRSLPGNSTMAYFFKPLTYNSQIAGYLIREYPGLWTTLDTKGRSLGTMGDDEILVKGTNTPDLRTAVRQVQKAVDQAAIRARQ